MIKVKAPDGTTIQFPDGTPPETIRDVMRKNYGGPQDAPEEARSVGDILYENIMGRGEADTPGEKLGQYIRGGTAAVARGLADVPALPANLAQLGALGVEKAFGMEEPSAVSRGLAALPDTREMLAAVPGIGPESQYVAPGKAGEYISTAGEFAGGAGGATGARTMLKYGAVPGLASEAAGQVTEGTGLEPYARTAAAVAAPLAMTAAQRTAQRLVSPMAGQISPERQRAVDELRRAGVEPTAGQVVGGKAAEPQLYREAATAAGRSKADEALSDFTAAVMKSVGSNAKAATPDALEEAAKRIGSTFDDIVENVDAMPQTSDLTAMSQALETYRQIAPKATAAPIFTSINKELVRAARAGNSIPASTLKEWRSTVSKLTTSSDTGMRSAAIETVDVLDDMIENALVAAGKPEAVQALSTARNQYRNLLAIEKAAARADVEGILSPLQLRSALLMQGRRRFVQGKGDLGPLTRAAADVLKPLPQSGTAPRIRAGEILPGAAGGTGAGLGASALGLDPVAATAVGAATAAAPMARNAFLSSDIGQRYFLNQLMKRAEAAPKSQALGLAPGLLSQ